MKEIWLPVRGYEGYYEVSNMGKIRSIGFTNSKNKVYTKRRNPRLLKNGLDKNGYALVALCNHGVCKTFKVHRIVAETFIPNPNNESQINHINEIKNDNRVENLEYCSALYNNNYGSRITKASMSLRNNKRQSKPILQYTIDGIFVAEYPSAKEAKRQTGIFNITLACNHKMRHKTAGGYIWKWK